jgi:protein-disulfide isomerase
LAATASMLARCAGDKSVGGEGPKKYFDVVERLLRDQNDWAEEEYIQPLMTFATKQLGFTNEKFKACLTNRDLLHKLSDARSGAKMKVKIDAIPIFFINGNRQKNYLSMEQMVKLIDPLLKKM